MEQPILTNGFKRTFAVMSLFMLIGTFTVFAIGMSLQQVRRETLRLSAFLASAEDIQFNFEKSLQMYTESTKVIINYLYSLRPADDKEMIGFISAVEDLAQKLSLNINAQSLDSKAALQEKPATQGLAYTVSFYGNFSDLERFLQGLEHLPYFLRIARVDFINPDQALSNESFQKENVKISLFLFTQ